MKALITGASSGIGKEIAYNLANRGIDLVLASRNIIVLEQIADELRLFVKVEIFQADLSIEKSAFHLYHNVINCGHQVDILVNNAGFGLFGKNNELDVNQLEKMIILNSASLTSLCSLFGKDMEARGFGYILNVASTAAFQPIPYFAAYSASKAYVKSFSKALHYELINKGVSVTCLNPGPTETNFFEVALNGEKFKLFQGKPMMTAKQVAAVGIEAMFDKKTEITAGFTNKIFSKILPIIPLKIVEKVISIYTKH
jgi:uncharacterized protein